MRTHCYGWFIAAASLNNRLEGDSRFGLQGGIAVIMIRRCAALIILVGVIAAFAFLPAGYAATNAELVPGSRIVFPYYDLRPGFSTLLFLTNVSTAPVSVNVEFYDTSCASQGTNIELSGHDIDSLDLTDMIAADSSGRFRQGFVDVSTTADVLLGTALITNVEDDWAIAYNGASARQLSGGTTPFEPYPSGLILPAFLTPGHIGGGVMADGMLVIAAPNRTGAGGKLPDEPIHASAEILLRQDRPPIGGPRPRPHDMIVLSSGFSGHYIMAPIGSMTGTLPAPTLGWLSLTNHATDKNGVPIGLVGLYIQTLLRPGGGSAMAVRLSGDPSVDATP